MADKVIVVWISTTLTVWTCCLVMLWAVSFDASPETTLLTISATFLAISFAISLPGRVVRTTRRVRRRLGLSDPLATSAPQSGPKRSRTAEARASMRLLGASVILAVAGGLLSTAALLGSKILIDTWIAAMLFSPVTWRACKLMVAFVGMLPIACGIALSFLMTGMVQAGSGRDIYASVFREWLWGIAGGLGVFAVCRQWGLSVQGVVSITAVALLGGAGIIFQRLKVTTRPGQIRRPVENPSLSRRLGIALMFGVIALAIIFQLRLFYDAAGIGLAGAGLWMSASVGLLSIFLRRVDHKSRPPGNPQQIGASVGACGTLLLQGALLISGTSGGIVGVVCCLGGLALQVPLTGMAALILSRQRRTFAYAGGRARQYVCFASGGVGLAILGYMGIASIPGGPVIVFVGVLGLCVGWILKGITGAKRAADQLKWAINGTILLCSMTVGILGAIRHSASTIGRVRPGVWLTTVIARSGSNPSRPITGVLPNPQFWRGKRIDQMLSEILERHKGRWWVVAGSANDLPRTLDPDVHVTISSPDPTAVDKNIRADPFAKARGRGFFSVIRSPRELFDGILITPLSTDNPHAWRCYNTQTMHRALEGLQKGGLAVLRLQSRDGGMGLMLGAVRTFESIIGPCWIAFEHRAGQLDILIFGPAWGVRRPQGYENVIVCSSKRLWYEWPNVRPLSLLAPRRTMRQRPDVNEFVEQLTPAQPM